MKKSKKITAMILAVVLIVVILLCFVQCNGKAGEAMPTQTTAADTADPTVIPTTEGSVPATEPTTDPTTEATQPSEETTAPTAADTEPTTSPTEPAETTAPNAHTHSYTAEITAPTCTEDGYTMHICACGDSYTDSRTTATGHNWGSWVTVKEPTTTATGTAERTCSKCAAKETKTLGKVVEDHTHNYTGKVTKEPSCTEEGVKVFNCSCGDSYTEAVEKLGHSYKDTKVAPTCTEGGYTVHTCTRCSETYIDSRVAAKGHSYKSSVTKAPTCEAGGTTVHTCTACSDSYTETVPATGHNYSVTAFKKPTCCEAGFTTYTCSNCRDSYTETAPTTGHNWEHHHTPATGHYEAKLVCHCGWSCTESEAAAAGYDIITYYTIMHANKYIGTPDRNNHSYDTEDLWVEDTPASDLWVCVDCGKETKTKP